MEKFQTIGEQKERQKEKRACTINGAPWRGTDDRYLRKLFKFFFLIIQSIVNKLTAYAHPKNLLTTYAHAIKIAQDRYKLFHFIF